MKTCFSEEELIKLFGASPLSKGTPLSTNSLFLSNFFMIPLFVQVLKIRTPLILGGGNYVNTNITFKTNFSILSNTITKFISSNRHTRKTLTTPIRFLHILIIVKIYSSYTAFKFLFQQKRITVDVQFQQVFPAYYQQLLWHHGVVFITTAELHSTKPELRFCAGSNPACGMSEIYGGENL